MLLQFSCKNHRSIKSEVVFSAVSTTDTEHIETLIDFDEQKILYL